MTSPFGMNDMIEILKKLLEGGPDRDLTEQHLTGPLLTGRPDEVLLSLVDIITREGGGIEGETVS
jgi:hypothetical protein